MRLKGLIFDLDGTLVDTAPDLAAATNHVLASEGRRAVTMDEIRTMVGRGARRMIERGFAATGEPLAPERMEPLFERFLAHYSAHIADESRLFPGVADLIARCRAAEIAMAVCTNKPEALSARVIEAVGLSADLPVIVGPDTIGIAKPDPAPYLEACWRLGLEAGETLMIGDSETDVATARAAEVPIIAVSFGYTDRPVASFSPDHIVDHFDEVWGLIEARAAVRS